MLVLNEDSTTSIHMSVWFSKVLVYVRICKEVGDFQKCELHCQRNCPACQHDSFRELCFVQLMGMLDSQ